MQAGSSNGYVLNIDLRKLRCHRASAVAVGLCVSTLADLGNYSEPVFH